MSDSIMHALQKSIEYEGEIKQLRHDKEFWRTRAVRIEQDNILLRARLDIIDAKLAKERQRGTEWMPAQ